ncbi:MAG TPA: MiaB/RimO family radical SAM methylthiotransferase [Gemmatimonadaceae bacterium]|nr:MiaB/RimO family radical SAM methylthiotransferase [Gemmatimonadaceae bacterium]
MKVYLRTFGCRANQYDSEQVRALVERSGGVIVEDPSEADTAVFNSCAVTSEAEVELRKSIRGAARVNPGLRTVVMGCAAALDRGRLAELPTVAGVVGGGDASEVARAIGLPPAPGALVGMQHGTRALLRIQEGCDEHCTFCATTMARGANRSRPADDLVAESLTLAAHHPEIVLTGIHIGTWGRDIESTLGALVRRLVRDVPKVRFRLSSVEATEVDDQLRELFGEPARLAPHLHAPLQSGSDRVLKRMGRHWYTSSTYARAVERLVMDHDVFALGADVIAGFPGEEEEDHRVTMELVRALPFTYLHIFPYSARPGTSATRLAGQVDGNVVRRRAGELRAISEQLSQAHRERRRGGSADVIVIRGDRLQGLTEDYLQVDLEGPRLPRGSRVAALLSERDDRLVAIPA